MSKIRLFAVVVVVKSSVSSLLYFLVFTRNKIQGSFCFSRFSSSFFSLLCQRTGIILAQLFSSTFFRLTRENAVNERRRKRKRVVVLLLVRTTTFFFAHVSFLRVLNRTMQVKKQVRE